ncbi:MAG: hypothetical protein RIC89_02465 [Pseudomonadales bacterium]
MPTEIIILSVLVFTVTAALIGWLIWRRQDPFEREIRKFARIASDAHLQDILLPDGMGGEIHIAHLLRTDKGLLLLDPRSVRGMVFAGEKMQEWSATESGTRLSFANPIPALLDRLAAVRAVAQGVPVEGKVVFHNDVTFPKGHPSSVTTIKQLIDEYTPVNKGQYTLYQNQWLELEELAKLQGN